VKYGVQARNRKQFLESQRVHWLEKNVETQALLEMFGGIRQHDVADALGRVFRDIDEQFSCPLPSLGYSGARDYSRNKSQHHCELTALRPRPSLLGGEALGQRP
jgi:hypothetical protein